MGARACGQGPCDAASPPSHNAIHNGPHRAVQRPRAGAAADQIGARAVFPTGGAQPREPSRGKGTRPGWAMPLWVERQRIETRQPDSGNRHFCGRTPEAPARCSPHKLGKGRSGGISRPERNRAERAESSWDTERARTDELRDRVEALQVQLVTAEADGSALGVTVSGLFCQIARNCAPHFARNRDPSWA